MHSFFSTQSLLKHYQNPLKIRLFQHKNALKNSGFMVSFTHQKALYFKGLTMANSPKDDTDLSAIPLKKLDAILNQIQQQNALISEQGSQIHELSTENEKLRLELKTRGDRNDYLTSLLARANAENKRRNEIVEGFKSMLFKVGQTSEAGIVSKFLQSTKQEEIQEQPSIQTSIFGEDNAIFVLGRYYFSGLTFGKIPRHHFFSHFIWNFITYISLLICNFSFYFCFLFFHF